LLTFFIIDVLLQRYLMSNNSVWKFARVVELVKCLPHYIAIYSAYSVTCWKPYSS